MTTEPKPKTPVLIAVSMRNFKTEEDTPMHLRMLLGILAASPDLPWTFEMTIYGGGGVAHARNKCVAVFLRGVWKWLSFLDDDMMECDDPALAARILADQLIAILSRRLHVCGGLYTSKDEENPRWVMNAFREPEIDETGLLIVPELGTGLFKTYHRSVFETLIKNEPGLDYISDDSAAPEWGFFSMGVVAQHDRRRWLTEDYWLDHLCAKHNISVHVDTKVRSLHRGADGVFYPVNKAWPKPPGPSQPVPPPAMASEQPDAPFTGTLVICLQFWEGDRKAAMRLARFIADLEPEFRKDVVLAFVKRHDTTHDQETLDYVSRKMPVSSLSAPEHKVGYPVSPNVMAIFSMHIMASQYSERDAILLMEADCIPIAKDWINQLRVEWGRAAGQGKLLMGSWRPESSANGHINGNLVFSPRLASVLNNLAIPKKAWDVFFVPQFEPHWMRTGLIANRYCEMYVKPEKLALPECGTKPPVLIHGVKDNSVWEYAIAQTGVHA